MVASLSVQRIDTERKKPLVTEWLVDSGCSSHMTPDASILSDFKQIEDPVNIKIGDISCLKTIGQGSIATTIGCSDLFRVEVSRNEGKSPERCAGDKDTLRSRTYPLFHDFFFL